MTSTIFQNTKEAAAQPTGDGLGVLSKTVKELDRDFLYGKLSKRNRR
jgi:hypothetical protein